MALSTKAIMRMAVIIRDWMLSILSIILLLLIVFWISAFLYGSFYFTFMPSRQSYAKTIHLSFDPCPDATGARCTDLKGEAKLDDDLLMVLGQKYSVGLTLRVPRSDRNKDLGMFMVCLTMVSNVGSQKLEESETCRSALLTHRSTLTEVIQDALRAPWSLMQITDSSEEITVEFFNDYIDNYRERATTAQIVIKSRKLDVHQCTLHVHAHFSGLPYFMYHHPVLSSCLGISCTSTFVFSLLFFFWKKVFEPSVVVAMTSTSSNANMTIAQRQEMAREKLSKSSSQQKLLKKVSEGVERIESDLVTTTNSDPEASVRRRVSASPESVTFT